MVEHMYKTMADISHAVMQLSRHMSAPTHAHWALLKHIFRYLKGHNNGIRYYRRSTPMQLVGYVDAKWAGDARSRRSTTGYMFTFGGAAVSWNSRLQPIVATSSTEAEYIALSTAAQEAVALRRLFPALRIEQQQPTVLYEDNQGAIALSNNAGGDHRRTKHIDVRYHYVRELVDNKHINIMKISTEVQCAESADLFES